MQMWCEFQHRLQPDCDDVIATKGNEFVSVNDDIINNAEAAIAVIDDLTSRSVSLYDSALAVDVTACENAVASPASGKTACHLFGYVKRITDSLKTDVVVLLNTDIPQNAQGDGD